MQTEDHKASTRVRNLYARLYQKLTQKFKKDSAYEIKSYFPLN